MQHFLFESQTGISFDGQSDVGTRILINGFAFMIRFNNIVNAGFQKHHIKVIIVFK